MQNPQSQTVPEPKRLDWTTMVVPFLLIIILCLCFLAAPDASKAVLENLRSFLGENFGVGYLAIGLGIFLLSIYIAFSRYGTIRLGKPDEKPLYSNFAWGSMMFTSGLAADILFYSLCEWVLYANDPHLAEMGSIQDWASTYPLFHWGPIPWGFYVVLAAAFGFMLHVRGCHKQKYSEACRPILGKHTDGLAGTLIDLMAVFALLAGTTTTFTLATPLMSQIVSELFGFSDTRLITIAILAVTCLVYTVSVVSGMKGIQKLAASCVYLFFALLAYVLLFGGEARYIIETGFSSIGNLVQNFIGLSTYTDPQRTTSFPQTWTMFYWAYWMVWCPVLHRNHLSWTYDPADNPRRLRVRAWRHVCELYYTRKLQPGTPGVRKTGCHGALCRQWRPLFHNHCHHPHASARPNGPRSARGGDDRLLCHQL